MKFFNIPSLTTAALFPRLSPSQPSPAHPLPPISINMPHPINKPNPSKFYPRQNWVKPLDLKINLFRVAAPNQA